MRNQFLDYLFFFQNGLDVSFVLLTLRSFVLQLWHPESEHKCHLCSQIENWNWTFDSFRSAIEAIIGIICVLLDNNFKITYCGPAHDPVHSLSSHMRKKFWFSLVNHCKGFEFPLAGILQLEIGYRSLWYPPNMLEIKCTSKIRVPDDSDSKEPACTAGDQIKPLGWEDSLEKGMATHSSILAWRIPWTEEPGRQHSMGCKESAMTEWWTLLLFTT